MRLAIVAGGRATNGAQNLLDVRSALLQAGNSLHLLQTVQWATRYFWFLPSDPDASLAFYPVLADFAALRRRAELVPAARGFESLPFCLRSLLDGLFERLKIGDNSFSVTVRTDHDLPPNVAALLNADEEGKQAIDSKFVQLCCPVLDTSRQALVVRYTRHDAENA